MDPRTVASTEVHLLHLNDDGSPKVPRSYVYIDPQSDEGFTLRFSIEGTSPICRHGSLWINVPAEGAGFKREEYREFPYVDRELTHWGYPVVMEERWANVGGQARPRLQPHD